MSQDRTAGDDIEVIRHEEELHVRLTSVPYERIRLSKRVVTETMTVEVQRQREELVVEHLPLDAIPGDPAPPAGTPARRLRDSVLSRFAARRQPAAVGAEEVTLELLEEQYEVVERVVPLRARPAHVGGALLAGARERRRAQGAGRDHLAGRR